MANIWYSEYQAQLAKPEIDLIPTATMGLQYINFSHHVRSSASRWLGDPESDMVKLSRSYLQEADDSRKSGNPSRILELVGKSRTLEMNVAPLMAKAMDDKYDNIASVEKIWEKSFLFAYILGALTLGASFLISQRELPPKQLKPSAKVRK